MQNNTYWKSVLEEVLNKDDIDYEFRFTSVGIKEQMSPTEIAKLTDRPMPARTMNRYELGSQYGAEYLTQREYDVLEQLLVGSTVKEVADDLVLSPRTVEFYVKNLKVKFCCKTRGELELRARATGLFLDVG